MKDDAEILEGGPYFGREADYGILKLAFYQCARCKVCFCSYTTLEEILINQNRNHILEEESNVIQELDKKMKGAENSIRMILFVVLALV